MNLGEISEYIQRRILKKENYDPEVIRSAINEAQLEMQRGVLINGQMVQRDWTAMEAHYVRDYQPGGIALEDAVTRVRMVFHTRDDGEGGVYRGEPLRPSSEDAQDVKRDHHNHDFYPTATGDDTGMVRHRHGHVVWWVEERKLMLSRHGHAAGDLNLWFDVYRVLPCLVNPTDSNWFTVHAWDALAWKACALGFGNDVDVEAATFFDKMATARIQSAINADQRFAAAGTADVVRPPRPQIFPRENRASYD